MPAAWKLSGLQGQFRGRPSFLWERPSPVKNTDCQCQIVCFPETLRKITLFRMVSPNGSDHYPREMSLTAASTMSESMFALLFCAPMVRAFVRIRFSCLKEALQLP